MPCQSCVKRGIQCSFDGAAEGQERFDNEVLPRGTQNPALPEVNRQIIQSFQAQNLVVSDAMDVDGAGPGLGMTQTLPAFETFDQANSAPTIPVPPSNVSPRLRLNSGFLKRAHQHPIDAEAGELYFTHFHPRWPIIHIASYDEDAVGLQTLNYSVMMVGVWLNGTTISQDEAVAMHIRLMDKLFPRLVSPLRLGHAELSDCFVDRLVEACECRRPQNMAIVSVVSFEYHLRLLHRGMERAPNSSCHCWLIRLCIGQ